MMPLIRRGGACPCPSAPPVFQSSVYFRKKLRYQASAAITTTATPSQIGSYFVMGTVVNTTVTKWVNQIRIRSVTLWAGPNATTFTPTTISLQFNGTLAQVSGTNRTYSDQSMGSNSIAHLRVKPDPMSTAADWVNVGGAAAPGTSPIFTYTLPAGGIIEIDCDVTVANDDSVVSTISAATVVLGQLYALALDHGTSDVVVPLSVTTTV